MNSVSNDQTPSNLFLDMGAHLREVERYIHEVTKYLKGRPDDQHARQLLQRAEQLLED